MHDVTGTVIDVLEVKVETKEIRIKYQLLISELHHTRDENRRQYEKLLVSWTKLSTKRMLQLYRKEKNVMTLLLI